MHAKFESQVGLGCREQVAEMWFLTLAEPNHMQLKLVSNEQCERMRFLETGFGKPIQPKQLENGFSVNTLKD